MTYKERISETVFSLFEKEPPFIVSWSHYLQLMRIENEAERSLYEIESAKTGWGVRTLQRQYNSSLYERLALSRDKEGVLRLATEGNVIAKQEDIIKQPSYEKEKVRFFLLWGALNEQLQENTIKYCTDLSAQKIFVSQIPYFEGFYVQCENKGAMKTILERWKNENTTLKTAIEDFL